MSIGILNAHSPRAPWVSHETKNATVETPQEEQSAAGKQQDLVYTILDSRSITTTHSIIAWQEWRDFDFPALLKNLDRTQTTFGAWGLRTLIVPVADMQQIQARQQLIQELVVNSAWRNSLSPIMAEINALERDVLAYWDEYDDLNDNAQELYYATAGSFTKRIDEYLNNNKLALENAAMVDIGKNVFALGSVLGAAGLFNELINAAATRRTVSIPRGIINGLTQPLRIHSFSPQVFTHGYDEKLWHEAWTEGSAKDHYLYIKDGLRVPSFVAAILTCGHVIGYDLSFAINVRDAWKRLNKINQTYSALHKRMINVAKLFCLLAQLHESIAQYSAVCKSPELAALREAADFASNPVLQQLWTLLQKPTFTDSSSYFYSRGTVLLAHKILNDNKDELVPLLQLVGLCDAYLSIAMLYQEHQAQKAQFCFVTFDEKETPALEVVNFWTPLMHANEVVCNSVAWGYDNAIRHVVLTGPNGAGKSTIMKALGCAIIMAQAWGMAPASSMRLTPFTGVYSSFIQRDNLAQHLSTFMAEKARVDEIRTMVKKHEAGERHFILLDEPYRGTVESESARLMWLLGHEIAQYPHAMFLVATHLEKPTRLEKETGVFANFHMEITEAQGKFNCLYKLVPGIAHWWFEDEEKRSRFIDQLLVGHQK